MRRCNGNGYGRVKPTSDRFLGWRCLYAETVNSRIESRTIDLEKALKRAVSMLIDS